MVSSLKKRKVDLGEDVEAQNHASTLTEEKQNMTNRKDTEPLPTINYLNGTKLSPNYYKIFEQRKTLPIYGQKDEFMKEFNESQIIILVGETGSGKTTQIPQFCCEYFYKNNDNIKDKRLIACTQPRRVAAISVSTRVATEMDVKLGQEVGYTIRFEDMSSDKTRLKYLTDGMLLREAMIDHKLSNYSTIIIDEAHERTKSTDVLLGQLKEILNIRKDLKLVVMSATLDATKFQDYFNNAPLIKVPGRLHPVELFYTPSPVKDYFEAAIRTVLQIHTCEPEGDILLFLTGEQEIENAVEAIRESCELLGNDFGPVLVVPLYSTLPPQLQQRIFNPAPPPRTPDGPPGRKIVVSTNIAETSLTIDGIVYVVDPGFCKQNIYNPRTRAESLLVSHISKASAQQRAGRAGRTRPGKCFRLYTLESFNTILVEQTYPEMCRCNIASVVLHLKTLGIDDIVHFDFLDPPPPEALMRAQEMLNYIGALDDDGELTKIGKIISTFPVEPEQAKMLLESSKYSCSNEIVIIVSMLNTPQVFITGPSEQSSIVTECHKKFSYKDSDHITLLNIYQEYKNNLESQEWCWKNYLNHRSLKSADNIRSQQIRMMEKYNITINSTSIDSIDYYNNIRQALLEGFFMQVAHLQRNSMYLTVKDQQIVRLHPSTSIIGRSEWVLYHEFVLTTEQFIRTVTAIRGEWLIAIAPHYYDLSNFPPGNTRIQIERLYEERQRILTGLKGSRV